ncbi:MAG: PIN domain-containing protein [Acidobacteriota bacterium]
MSYAVDTNILARSIREGHPMQQITKDAIKTLLDRGETVCVPAQSLYEFWVIATRPLEANGFGMSVAEAQVRLAEFEVRLTLKTDTAAIYAEWKQLVTQHSVMGKPAHDARIVAAMKVHGITHLLTFNVGDFKRFQQITVISPTEVQ